MKIDLRTLALILCLAYGLQALILFFQYLIDKTYRGIGYWVWGFASIALGFILLALREVVSQVLIFIFLGNGLLVLGSLFLYVGLMRFVGKRESRGLAYSILAVFSVSFFYFTVWHDEMTIRSVLLFVTLAIYFFWSASGLLIHRTRPITASVYLISGIFFAQGGLSVARVAIIPFGDSQESIFSLTAIHTAAFLIPLVAGFLLTFGFIMMINQRLNGEIREAKEEVELIFNTSPDASMIIRVKDGVIVNINEGFTALTGYRRDEIVGKSNLEVHVWKNPADRQRFAEELGKNGFCENFEAEFLRKDQSPVVGMISGKIIRLKNISHIVSFTRDITDRKRAEEALRTSEMRYRAVAHSASDAIISADVIGNIIGWNRGAEKMFGYTVFEVSGQPLIQLMPERYRDWHTAGMSRLRAGGEPRIIGKSSELEALRKDGSEFPIELSLARWETAEGRFYTAIIRDITDRKRYQDQLEYFAIHDPLTGLLNRHSLEDQLNRTIARAKRGVKSSLLYMDLDNFKDVNDTVGHSAGDEVLITLTNLLKAELRIEDIVFRLGGDEFAVLLDGMESREALPAAERLRFIIEAHPFELRGRIFPLSLSIGLIQIDGSLEPGELLSQADAAMYQAKGQGKNRVVIFKKESR